MTQLSHFNLTALMKESARWPLAECLQWAGVDADGGLAALRAARAGRSVGGTTEGDADGIAVSAAGWLAVI